MAPADQGAGRRRDSAIIDLAIDAVRVTDDFVRGVLGLADGRIGGGDDVKRNWTQRLFSQSRVFGEQHVVRGLGAGYAPEQLRKAANEADEMVAALDDLALAWTPPARDAHAQLQAIGLAEVPEILRRPAVGSTSPELREVHERLSRAVAVLNEARTKAILAEMRAARDETRPQPP